MNVEKRLVTDLVHADYNPRKRLTEKDAEYQKIKRSLEEFGYVDPIIINSDNTIIGGHQRATVLQALGYTEIDVVVVDMDKTKEKALNVALNKISGEWDFEKLEVLLEELQLEMDATITGFDDEDIQRMLEDLQPEPIITLEDEEYDADAAAEEIVDPKTKRGEIWQLGNHRLMCGDSTDKEDVSCLMDNKVADMVFTDPPYALFGNSTGVAGVGDDKMIMPFFRSISLNIKQFLKYMGHAYVCCDWQTSSTIKEAAAQLTAKNLIVWQKMEAGGLGAYYTKIYELIWLFANEPETGIIGRKKYSARTINGVPNIWKVPIVASSERVHNAQKPLDVMKIAIENSSEPGEIVLDLFGGGGSTMMACEQINRACYMMELEPKYCDVIINRWEQFTGQKAVKIA